MMCDCDPPTLYNQSWPTAQKAHRCCECSKAIAPGEKYQRVEGLWDGEWNTYKTCVSCARLREGIASDIRRVDPLDCGPCFGELHFER